MLKDFYNACRYADWHAAYSDDRGVRNRGEARMAELKEQAKQSPEHQAIFDAFREHKWNRGPVPAEPVE